GGPWSSIRRRHRVRYPHPSLLCGRAHCRFRGRRVRRVHDDFRHYGRLTSRRPPSRPPLQVRDPRGGPLSWWRHADARPAAGRLEPWRVAGARIRSVACAGDAADCHPVSDPCRPRLPDRPVELCPQFSRPAATLMTDFDRYATNYDTALTRALTVSGENKEYFARGRIVYLKDCLDRLNVSAKSVLDFGCGIGSGTTLRAGMLDAVDVLGVDVSARSIDEARRSNSHVRFMTLDEYVPACEFDLAFCNGVFHHIPPDDRPGAVDFVFRALRPGGLFAFWENNPWNPGTRYVMAQCEFDRDAVMLSARHAQQLLTDGQFEVIRTSFLFIFPRRFGFLRRYESR